MNYADYDFAFLRFLKTSNRSLLNASEFTEGTNGFASELNESDFLANFDNAFVILIFNSGFNVIYCEAYYSTS